MLRLAYYLRMGLSMGPKVWALCHQGTHISWWKSSTRCRCLTASLLVSMRESALHRVWCRHTSLSQTRRKWIWNRWWHQCLALRVSSSPQSTRTLGRRKVRSFLTPRSSVDTSCSHSRCPDWKWTNILKASKLMNSKIFHCKTKAYQTTWDYHSFPSPPRKRSQVKPSMERFQTSASVLT